APGASAGESGEGRVWVFYGSTAPPPCDDGVACTHDTSTLEACRYVPDDALCDNDLYCDGPELCDPLAGCQPGTGDPCAAPTTCDESNARCTGCSVLA